MPRQKRINFIGYCYLSNRGIGNKVVFKEKEDYHYFEMLLCQYSQSFAFTLHNYTLMASAYFLLIETQKANLSDIMRQLNGTYSRYFNKKYHGAGHLWQERFKSWYIQEENQLPSLIRYIEKKPFKHTKTLTLGSYAYSSARYLLEEPFENIFLKNSWLRKNHPSNTDFMRIFLNMSIDDSILRKIEKVSRTLKIDPMDKKISTYRLQAFFHIDMSKKERNIHILKASKEGFSQYQIAETLGISQPAVHGIIKRLREE